MVQKTIRSLFLNARMLAMLCLGFSSGLPLALTGSTLQAWYTESGISVLTIGALSLVGMPYVWKFLWAPIMDRFVPGGRGRRGWILIAQIALCVSLAVIATIHPEQHPLWMASLALGIAFLSASQDIAVDAYRADVLPVAERGFGSATFIFAYRMAMLVSGGLALVMADHYGWPFTYQVMSGLLLLSALATYFAPEVPEVADRPTALWATIKGSFGALWQRDAVLLLLLFVIFYKLGDAFAASLMSPFLLKGLGFSLSEVGVAYKTTSLLGALLGSFLGGILLARIPLFRALICFGLAQAVSTLFFVVLAMMGKNFLLMATAVFIENFCSGMGTAAFIVFLMSLCDHRYTATQYACLSALSAVGRVFLGPLAGVMVMHWGWVNFYVWAFILSFPGLLLLGLLQGRVSFDAKLLKC